MHETQTAGQLTEREAAVVAGKAAGHNAARIAADINCSPDTVYRLLRQPHVRAALDEARAERWRPDAERLRAEVCRSIDALVTLRDGGAHPSTKLRAAVAIIELATQLHELVEVLPRLAAIDAALDRVQGREGVRDAD